MKSWISKPVLSVLVILQLYSSFTADNHHLEDVFGLPNAPKSLTSHDCGANEIHKDIPHFCLACLRQANFGFQFSTPVLPGVQQTLCSCKFIRTTGYYHSDIYISASKRGPPSSVVIL